MFSRGQIKLSMVKLIFILAIFLCAECAAGRYEIKKSRGKCISYGHACWGAHGKRNGKQESLVNNAELLNRDNSKAEWFLSKLMVPMDFRYYSDGSELDVAKNHPIQEEAADELLTNNDIINNNDNSKIENDWIKLRQFLQRPASNLNNFLGENDPKFLDKRSNKD